MSDLNALRKLLLAAYRQGFGDGNGRDWGCMPEDDEFDEWFAKLDQGDQISAIADIPNKHPELAPGFVWDTKAGEYVILEISSRSLGSGVFLEVQMRDRESYEFERQVPPF